MDNYIVNPITHDVINLSYLRNETLAREHARNLYLLQSSILLTIIGVCVVGLVVCYFYYRKEKKQ